MGRLAFSRCSAQRRSSSASCSGVNSSSPSHSFSLRLSQSTIASSARSSAGSLSSPEIGVEVMCLSSHASTTYSKSVRSPACLWSDLDLDPDIILFCKILHMNFEKLVQDFGAQPFFDLASVVQLSGEARGTVLTQLHRWRRGGKILPLRRSMYTLADHYRRKPVNPAMLANSLYRPSYIKRALGPGVLRADSRTRRNLHIRHDPGSPSVQECVWPFRIPERQTGILLRIPGRCHPAGYGSARRSGESAGGSVASRPGSVVSGANQRDAISESGCRGYCKAHAVCGDLRFAPAAQGRQGLDGCRPDRAGGDGATVKEEALSLVSDVPDPARRLNLLREYVQACVLRSLHESEAFLSLSFVGRFGASIPFQPTSLLGRSGFLS